MNQRFIKPFVLSFSVLCILLLSSAELAAQTYLISDGGTVNTCSGTIYDSGGAGGDYGLFEEHVMTFCSDEPDACLQLDFIAFNTEATYDFLYVYAGDDTNAPLIATLDGNIAPGVISLESDCVTLEFSSDLSITRSGFEIELTCTCPTCDDGILNGEEVLVDCGGPDCPACDLVVMDANYTVSNCGGTLFDSGIFDDYGPDEDYTVTLCAEDTESCLSLDFSVFEMETGFDSLIIYAGEDTNGEIIAQLSGELEPFTVNAPGTCMTLHTFTGSIEQFQGYQAFINCVCPTCDDGILNGSEVGIDCGGPDCPACDDYLISDGGTVNSCDVSIFDSGDDAVNYGNNEDHVMTFCSDGPDACIQLDFIEFNTEATYDFLYVYAGDDTNAPLIATLDGNIDPGVMSIESECVTLEFSSDGSITQSGFEIELSCVCPGCDDGILNGEEILVDCGGPDCPACDIVVIDDDYTVSNCGGTLFDSGIYEDYGPDEDYTVTLCSDDPESCMSLDFSVFEMETGFDSLIIYAGENTSGEVIAQLSGELEPFTVNAPGTCMTLHTFTGSIEQFQGYEALISCVCATCDDGIQNGQEEGIDCGGPDCPECEFYVISDEPDITGCSGTVYDSGGANGDYDNNEDYTMTICSDTDTDCIQLDFTSFDTEAIFDDLNVYIGTEVTATPFAVLNGNLGAFTLDVPASCTTLNFDSDGSVINPGFEFNIACIACPAPSESDCLGANEVCENIYVQENYPPDNGLFPIALPDEACLDNAENAIWYTFTVQESGDLTFVLTPQQAGDDYDWGLFNLTDAECTDIPDSPELLVSCNSYGSFVDNGPTGISSAEGGEGNVNGPGDTNGPPFNADYPVLAGETYALLVQNWTGSFDGYTLDFTGTTANIFYPGGPDVESIDVVDCGSIDITLSEPVDCATLTASDFLISSDTQAYTADSISSDCDVAEQTTMLTLFVNPLLPNEAVELEIAFAPDQGLILDLCGNPVPTDTSYIFQTSPSISILTERTDTECLEEIGTYEILEVYGGVEPLVYMFGGESMPDNLLVENLGVGLYPLLIEDAIGCTLERDIYITTELEEITLIMPNVFTPNGDEFNSLFGPMAIEDAGGADLGLVDVERYLTDYKLEVYNRWGLLVFESSRNKPFWNGAQDGGDGAEGTYYYVAQFREACSATDGELQEVRGMVTLLR